MKTILAPVDLSPVATQVCAAACHLANCIKGRVHLLHVVPPPPVLVNDYGVATEQLDELIAAGAKIAQAKLEALAAQARRLCPAVRAERRAGQPVATILAQAAKGRVNYIVLGSHGHTAVYDLLVGSTAHGVLRRAPCPVVVVPTGVRARPRRKAPARGGGRRRGAREIAARS